MFDSNPQIAINPMSVYFKYLHTLVSHHFYPMASQIYMTLFLQVKMSIMEVNRWQKAVAPKKHIQSLWQ